jgi:hypothetical protein
MGKNLLQRLRTQAALVRAWDRYELGNIAPEPLDYDALAELLDEAADRIVELERQR